VFGYPENDFVNRIPRSVGFIFSVHFLPGAKQEAQKYHLKRNNVPKKKEIRAPRVRPRT
jgi:hypothetical protein